MCFRLGYMPAFSIALDSNLEIMKGNLGGRKEEEKKRRRDQSMHSDAYKTRAEALVNHAFTFEKLFSIPTAIRVFLLSPWMFA